MGDALTWMVGNTTEDDHVVILTDSLSLVSKLQRGLIKKDWFLLLRHIPARMEVIYVPGHAGIRYNEKADWLAGKALPFGNLEPTAADIADAISRGGERRKHLDDGKITRKGDSPRRGCECACGATDDLSPPR